MRFTPTSTLPMFPDRLTGDDRVLPLPKLTDGEIDTITQYMLDNGAGDMQPATTQYGRRVGVDAMLRYHKIKPLYSEVQPWQPDRPAQPR